MRISRALLALVLAACGSGAGPGDAPGESGGPGDTQVCASGFRALEGGAGCEPILPSAACAPGTRAQIGEEACVPVGVTSCASGFAPHASGWGCDVVLPASACSEGTRERLGATSCAPVTDCATAFPPAAATLFVDENYTAGDLDETHFVTIAEALSVARDGSVIAIETGIYAEKVVPTASVTLIGRCSSQVEITSPDGEGSGLVVTKGKVVAKNLTLRGFRGGVAAFGGEVELEGIVVDGSVISGVAASGAGTVVGMSNVVVRGTRVLAGSNQAFGVVAQSGASVTVRDAVLADNDFANVVSTGKGSSVTLSRSVVRDGRSPDTGAFANSFGVGIYVSNGGSLAAEEIAILDNVSNALVVTKGTATGAAASGTLRRSVVRGTRYDPVLEQARGVEVGRSSTLLVEETTLYDNRSVDVLVREGGIGDVRAVTTIGPRPTRGASEAGAGLLVSESAKATVRSMAIVSSLGVGLQVQDEAELEMNESLVLAPEPLPRRDERGFEYGFGVSVRTGSSLTMARSTIDGARTVGLLAGGGRATLDSVLVTRTRASTSRESGRGISAQDGAAFEITRSAVVDNLEAGILVIDGNASLLLRDSTVGGTRLDADGRFGIGLLLAGGVAATLEGTTITGSEGIGLAASGSGCFVGRSFVSRNAVAVHVQDGAALIEADRPSDDPLDVVLTKDTKLIENSTRVGAGVVPLPSGLGGS
jgi:hypothetical protein